jgi:hypothetical protein
MDYKNWIGQAAIDDSGEKVGTIDQLYVDGETNVPTWATIKSGLFGTKTHFAPLKLAEPTDDGIRFAASAAAIHEAPGIEADQELSPHDQSVLYKHYHQQSTDGEDGKDADDTDDDREETDEENENKSGDSAGPADTVTSVTRSDDHSGDTEDSSSDGSTAETQRDSGQADRSGQPAGGKVRLRKYIITEIVTDAE